MEKVSRKKKKILEEEKIKAKMSEKAYLQRTLDKRLQLDTTIVFAQKFMIIAFGIFSLIMGLTLIVDRDIFWVVVTIIVALIFIGSLVWLVVDLVKYRPQRRGEIKQIREKLQVFSDQEKEKLEKMATFLQRQNSSSKTE